VTFSRIIPGTSQESRADIDLIQQRERNAEREAIARLSLARTDT
jgi:hypothetical protein